MGTGGSEKHWNQQPLRFQRTSTLKASQRNDLYELRLDKWGQQLCLCVLDYCKLKMAWCERCGADERRCARRQEKALQLLQHKSEGWRSALRMRESPSPRGLGSNSGTEEWKLMGLKVSCTFCSFNSWRVVWRCVWLLGAVRSGLEFWSLEACTPPALEKLA